MKHVFAGSFDSIMSRGECRSKSKSHFFQVGMLFYVTGFKSESLIFTHGVPQGYILGPLFFTIVHQQCWEPASLQVAKILV